MMDDDLEIVGKTFEEMGTEEMVFLQELGDVEREKINF